jgi:transcriptional regulator with XRE-family HTH domain
LPSDFLTRLRVLRAERNLTQQDFAREINMSQKSYNAIENGRSQPAMMTLLTIADYYNVSVDFLLGRSDKREF